MKFTTVTVRKSRYSDIHPGMEGDLAGEYSGGLFVRFIGIFEDATGKKSYGRRTMWFRHDELDGVPSEFEPPKPPAAPRKIRRKTSKSGRKTAKKG
jgi:hypothetical protein